MNEQRWLLLAFVGAVAITGGCNGPRTQGRAATGLEPQVTSDTQASALRPRVRLETSLGDVVLELFADQAPATVLNFVQYVESNFYDGTIFHRVLEDSMIQGGGYTPDMEEKPATLHPPGTDVWRTGLSHVRGTIAMVRGVGKAGSGTAQFFINVVDNTELDSTGDGRFFSIFGKVVEGMDTIERIRTTPVGPHPKYAAGRSGVVPIKPVVIRSVRLLTRFDAARVKEAAAATRAAVEERLTTRIKEIEKEAGTKAVITESGLRYVDFIIGKGPSPVPGNMVEFHYRGTLVDGTEFESTYSRGPAIRQVASLIAGLQEGLTTINEGGQRTLIIPPELGFGESGVPGLIPPDSTLIFEIELLAIR